VTALTTYNPGPLDRDTLRISETFLSLQGEGPSTGQRAVFLRLSGCNLSCTWCDTPYTWDWSRYDRGTETRLATPPSVAAEIATMAGDATRLLVLTGGEPLLQQGTVARTLDLLRDKRPSLRCEVETNGTVVPSAHLAARVHRFVVSPKLANSGIRSRARTHLTALAEFAQQPRAVLKFVVAGPGDLVEAADTAAQADFGPERVWIMPVATDPQRCLDLMRELASPVLDAGFNLSSRMHLLLWGDIRGR
jgi:7-carboxy-7-deazaguanine synthase